MDDVRRAVGDALEVLGVKNLVLGLQDSCFPGVPDEDLGRGTPGSAGAERFLDFAARLGFNGVQLGPQGLTHPASPSPYESTAFSRNPLDLHLAALVREGLLGQDTLARLVARREPGAMERVPYQAVRRAQHEALAEVFRRYRQAPGPWKEHVRRFAAANRSWLLPDALYDSLCALHGAGYFKDWGASAQGRFDQQLWNPEPGDESAAQARIAELEVLYADDVERYTLYQVLLARQREAFRSRLAARGLKLYGDLQVGLSAQDLWASQGLFLGGYLLGAPPSRTNPLGQPWGYPVLDPAHYGTARAPGRALQLLVARLDALFAECDGVRIDHPHGLVCPWVYRDVEANPIAAVQGGARLFESPALADHSALAPLAIAREEQLDLSKPRHADAWVRSLDAAQVARYSVLLDALVASAERFGRRKEDLVCEVLSTQPFPLAKVMERHGLGRFRVTQKANLDDPGDIYRSENARPEDWTMLGNHDTPPIWRRLEEWQRTGTAQKQARYLAERLAPAPEDRDAFAQRLASDPGLLIQAKFADVLASPARNVLVFFTDLLGMTALFNAPGTVSDENWSLRVPPDYADDYARKLEADRALNLPKALAMALRAKAPGHEDLLARLEDR